MANISSIISQIRQAILGKDVRENIASGIESINNDIILNTTKQNDLKTVFDSLIINAGNSNAEIVAGRYNNVTHTAHASIGERLDENSSALVTLTEYLNYMPVNGGDFDGADGNANVTIDGGIY